MNITYEDRGGPKGTVRLITVTAPYDPKDEQKEFYKTAQEMPDSVAYIVVDATAIGPFRDFFGNMVKYETILENREITARVIWVVGSRLMKAFKVMHATSMVDTRPDLGAVPELPEPEEDTSLFPDRNNPDMDDPPAKF